MAPKPKKKKPTVTKPQPSPKPKITKPAKKSADAVPPDVSTAFDDFEKKRFADTTTRVKDTTKTLTSRHGFFRVYQYTRVNQKISEVAIFFFNKRTKELFEIFGQIARKYLDILPKLSEIEDFPITNELPANADKQDRVSCLSRYSLTWNHSTGVVVQKNYVSYKPTKDNVLVACTQEFDPGMKGMNYENWKAVNDEKEYKAYKVSRKLRPTGMPTQVLLHETGTIGDLKITNARKEKDTFLIPHFCINKIDSSKKGNVLQYVDLAERTSHGPPLNDRSVGIEFVNAVFGSNLDKSEEGVFLKTVLDQGPDHKLEKYFLPLEFYPSDDKTGFVLTVPEEDLINNDALAGLKVGASNEKVVETTKGIVTIKNCRSDKFEHMVSLMRLLQSTGQVVGLDLAKREQYRNVHREEKKEKEYFLYQQAWVEDKKKVSHYGVDIRLPGIFAHGLTGTARFDGYAQALYLYLRHFRRMSAQAVLQKIIDLLVKSKAKGKNRPALEIFEKIALVSDKEVEPKFPITIDFRDRKIAFNPPIKINISNYLDIT